MNIFRDHKTRFYFLAGVTPLVFLVLWKVSFVNTIEKYQEYRQLKNQSVKYENPEIRIDSLTREIQDIQKNTSFNPEDADILLFEMIGHQINNYHITLETIPDIHRFHIGDYMLHTYRLTFSGGFKNLLRFMEYVEENISWCKIISVSFNRVVKKGNTEKLNLEIFMQTVYTKK